MKWHLKMHEKMLFHQRKREVTFFLLLGSPMCSKLGKCCFSNGSKIKKDFEKMKWHVKIHAKMPFDSRKKELTFFLFWGYPYAL